MGNYNFKMFHKYALYSESLKLNMQALLIVKALIVKFYAHILKKKNVFIMA